MDAGKAQQVQVEEQWRQRLARFAASGQSIKQFCETESVSVWSFYHWRKKLAASVDAQASPGFIDAGMMPAKHATPATSPVAHVATPAAALEVRLDLGHGIVLHIVRS